jgi:hypothetical protein
MDQTILRVDDLPFNITAEISYRRYDRLGLAWILGEKTLVPIGQSFIHLALPQELLV